MDTDTSNKCNQADLNDAFLGKIVLGHGGGFAPNHTLLGPIGGTPTKADNQPTLRDMWAMAIYNKLNGEWVTDKNMFREYYRLADLAIQTRDENEGESNYG